MTNATEPTVYLIPAANLESLRAKVEKIARRAARLGADLSDATPITLVVGERVLEEVTEHVEDDCGIAREVKRLREFYRCTVTGAAPRLAGWTFVATLQHEQAGTILRTVPGTTADLSAYRDAAPACDHCRANRRRGDTFVVRHEDGTLKQVGRQCVADFLGGRSPDAAARYAELLIELHGAMDEFLGGGRGEYISTAADYLALVACAIRTEGWVSRTLAQDTGKPATSGRAWSSRFPHPGMRRADILVPEQQDRDLAAAALAWAATALDRPGLSDFEHNLRVALAEGTVRLRTCGIVAALIQTYLRALGQERQRAARAAEVNVAAPTGRVEFEGQVVKFAAKNSDFGGYAITVKVETPEGVWLAWGTAPRGVLWETLPGGAQRPRAADAIVGARVRIKATLKPGREVHFAIMSRPAGEVVAAPVAPEDRPAEDASTSNATPT